MPDTDRSIAAPWAESSRRSLERRRRARRTRRNRWSLRAFAGVGLASLTLASAGALAATSATSSPAATASEAGKAKRPSTRQIQRALGIRADGVMGPRTRRAIKRFQGRNGLATDGVAGPATLKALGLAGGAGRSTSTSTGTSDSRSLQQAPQDATSALARIAQCESGGDPTAVSGDGRYRGKYQFTRGTWEAMGGTGDPAAADEATQDAVAAKLYAAEGTTPWPACGAGD